VVAQVRWIGLGLAVFITLDVLLTHLGDAVSFVTLAVGVAVALLGPRLLPLLRPIVRAVRHSAATAWLSAHRRGVRRAALAAVIVFLFFCFTTSGGSSTR